MPFAAACRSRIDALRTKSAETQRNSNRISLTVGELESHPNFDFESNDSVQSSLRINRRVSSPFSPGPVDPQHGTFLQEKAGQH
jgi:hypothetical protein